MAMTESTMLELGAPAPDFALPDTEGNTIRKSDFAGQPLLVMFICNHCPFVKHVAPELKRLGDDYAGKLGIVAISANDVANHPDDGPEQMKREKAERGYGFPYCYDASQDVAKAYTAACTPDFFLFDENHKLAYRGQLDETRPTRNGPGDYSHNHPPHGKDLRAAIDAVLHGAKPDAKQMPSMGCNIKWKAGNEPDYA